MTPKELSQVAVWLDSSAKEYLDTERAKLGLSQAAYLEKLLDGTLPGRLEKQMDEMRQELLAKIEEIGK